MLDKIPENIKMTILSSLPLAISLILFLLVGNIGISKIKEVGIQIDGATKEKNTLTEKLNILQTVGNSMEGASDAATNALPSGNSALLAISQLRNFAFANTLLLSNIKAGTVIKDTSGLSRNDISFEVIGTRAAIVTFLENVNTFAPITVVDSIKINESSGVAHAVVSIKTFWSALPTKLPAVTQALTDLTPDEKAILTSIGSLKQPLFLALPAPAAGGKTNPFSI